MSSVIIAGDTSGTVTLAAPAVAGSTTLTLQANTGNIPVVTGTGTSGQVLTSGGSGVVSTWTTVSAGSLTLLGTITPTAANSISLGSLSLSGYKQLCLVYKSLTANVTGSFGYISSDNTTSAARALYLYTSPASSGITWIDLGTGAFSGGIGWDVGDGSNQGMGLSNVSTSTTTLYFRLASTNTFTATGSIKVYGVV